MDDHSDDIRRPLSSRIEVYVGVGQKRWPDELKVQIVVESLEPDAVVTDIARRHRYRPQQVHDLWHHAFGTVGAAGFGGCIVFRAVGAGSFATGGWGAFRIAGGSC